MIEELGPEQTDAVGRIRAARRSRRPGSSMLSITSMRSPAAVTAGRVSQGGFLGMALRRRSVAAGAQPRIRRAWSGSRVRGPRPAGLPRRRARPSPALSISHRRADGHHGRRRAPGPASPRAMTALPALERNPAQNATSRATGSVDGVISSIDHDGARQHWRNGSVLRAWPRARRAREGPRRLQIAGPCLENTRPRHRLVGEDLGDGDSLLPCRAR